MTPDRSWAKKAPDTLPNRISFPVLSVQVHTSTLSAAKQQQEEELAEECNIGKEGKMRQGCDACLLQRALPEMTLEPAESHRQEVEVHRLGETMQNMCGYGKGGSQTICPQTLHISCAGTNSEQQVAKDQELLERYQVRSECRRMHMHARVKSYQQ